MKTPTRPTDVGNTFGVVPGANSPMVPPASTSTNHRRWCLVDGDEQRHQGAEGQPSLASRPRECQGQERPRDGGKAERTDANSAHSFPSFERGRSISALTDVIRSPAMERALSPYADFGCGDTTALHLAIGARRSDRLSGGRESSSD